jgi:cell division protein FtsW
VARRSADPFARLAAAAVTVWIVGQAVLNMGYVSGLLPVTGVPLPLISAGGTSLLVTLFALGMLASFARHEPAAAAQLARRGRVARLLRLPAPRPAGARRPRRSGPRSGPRSGVDRSGDRLASATSRTAGFARRPSGQPPRYQQHRPQPQSRSSPRREARHR